MKPSTLAGASTIVPELQYEMRRSKESRYDHRLHGVLLVAQKMKCPEVARLLGDSTRTVEYWIRRFEENGLAGLREGYRPGRPKLLNDRQIGEISSALQQIPESVGMRGELWSGKKLSAFIELRYGVSLGVRRCQYMFNQFGFRLRKPRPQIASAVSDIQKKQIRNRRC